MVAFGTPSVQRPKLPPSQGDNSKGLSDFLPTRHMSSQNLKAPRKRPCSIAHAPSSSRSSDAVDHADRDLSEVLPETVWATDGKNGKQKVLVSTQGMVPLRGKTRDRGRVMVFSNPSSSTRELTRTVDENDSVVWCLTARTEERALEKTELKGMRLRYFASS